MPFNLAAMMRRAGSRRRRVRFRPIRPKASLVRALEPINASVLDPWYAGIDGIVQAYDRPGRTGFADSADETSRLIDLIVLATNQAMIRIAGRVRSWGRNAERLHRVQWTQAVLAATSIDLGTILNPFDVDETVEAVIQRNTALIRSVSDSTRSRVADIVFRGVQQRTPTREVARLIREAVDIERRRAERIAADQTTKMYAALDKARQQEAGIDHFIWRHSGKAKPREHHKARDGVLYKWEAGAEGPGREPPQSGDMPGEPPYCGCTAQAVLLDEDGRPI